MGTTNEPDFKKEYLLLHEILTALSKSGMSISSSGKGDKRMPLYEFQVGTTGLYLGTLSLLLNNPQDLPKNKNGEVQFLRSLHITTDQIKEINYKISEIAQAVYLLNDTGELNYKITDIWEEEKNQPLTLTHEGYKSLITKKYLKEYQKALKDERIYDSTLSANGSTMDTNKWMKRFTGILAIAAALTFIIAFAQLLQQQSKIEPNILNNQLKITLSLDSLRYHSITNHEVLTDTSKHIDTR